MRSSASADLGALRDELLGAGVDGLEVVVEGLDPVPARRWTLLAAAFGGDAVQPGREGRVAAELPDALPGPEVCLLHHVARVLLVAGEPTRERERVDEGAPHQFVERLAVTAAGGPDQLGLVQPVLLMGTRFDPAVTEKGYAPVPPPGPTGPGG